MEFNLTVSADARFAGMVRGVAAHGARASGYGDTEAAAFGRTVEEAVLGMLAAAHPEASLTVAVRYGDGPLEIVIGSGRGTRTLTLDRVG
jgi:hypothetical protein